MVGAILFCLAVLPTALSTAASPRPLTRVRLDLRKLFYNSPVAFVTVLLVGVVNGAFGTLAAVFGTQIGLVDRRCIALMIGITIVSGAITAVSGRAHLRPHRSPLRHRRRGDRRGARRPRHPRPETDATRAG